ncbi:DUF6691 family protein [Methylomicrobium sp. RS1]|uniref:DUF6691 family protein n=1 Tax=Candidatus Methylomicrobium oryzae TaxID=2802053 RepID=UPI0019240A4D|nr:DUF6691 family protein [Methylomicrobium sp. RS1]MBL1265835.1 YeeE/YedE family protein [Methylomicrobium sp. RS1]
MAAALSALLCGTLFGLGLYVSQMINPEKVLGFLDVAGDWDPSLLLVMTGALATLIPLQWLILKRVKPICTDNFQAPPPSRIDKRLLTGATLFGIGWGLAGICPGPAISGLIYGLNGSYVFVGAMFIGMWLFHVLNSYRSS